MLTFQLTLLVTPLISSSQDLLLILLLMFITLFHLFLIITLSTLKFLYLSTADLHLESPRKSVHLAPSTLCSSPVTSLLLISTLPPVHHLIQLHISISSITPWLLF